MDRAELIEWLEKLTGPDGNVDYEIYHYLKYETSLGSKTNVGLQSYTASLDAAIALVEKVRPGWHWGRDVDFGTMQLGPDDSDDLVDANGATPAIALLIALLRSLDTEG